jgi:hypothetical protein
MDPYHAFQKNLVQNSVYRSSSEWINVVYKSYRPLYGVIKHEDKFSSVYNRCTGVAKIQHSTCT